MSCTSFDLYSGQVKSEALWIDVPDGRLKAKVFTSAELSVQPILVVVLHGDLLTPSDTYHYEFARTIASKFPDVVAAGLIRPGYTDEAGDRSDGDPLLQTGDNYTAEVVKNIAVATEYLKSRYSARAVVVVGHSGGAAISALMLGLYPDATDAAVLIACPCDLPAWRKHMMTKKPSPIWEQPHRGLSPLDFTANIRPSVMVEVVVGKNDQVALPEYSEKYAEVLRLRNIDVHISVFCGLSHKILMEYKVIKTTLDLISRVEKLKKPNI